MWPKKACVSTLLLKWHLSISQLQNAPWPRPDGVLWRAPGGVKPLEVRCAHPVRLSPDTHSQGEAAEKDIGIESP